MVSVYENLIDLYRDYEHIGVTFESYYKYKFVFRGELGGTKVYVQIGGDADSIYRAEVIANVNYELRYLIAAEEVCYLRITSESGEVKEWREGV